MLLPVYLLHALGGHRLGLRGCIGPRVRGRRRPVRPLVARRPRRGAVRRLALVTGVVALGVLYSITAPWLAQRRVEDAYSAIARADAGDALSAARQARDLNPLSVDPLWAWALAEATARNPGADDPSAISTATELQPENSDTWYALGQYEFALRRYRDAYVHLDRAYGLDPYGPAGLPGGLLDQARAKVEGR